MVKNVLISVLIVLLFTLAVWFFWQKPKEEELHQKKDTEETSLLNTYKKTNGRVSTNVIEEVQKKLSQQKSWSEHEAENALVLAQSILSGSHFSKVSQASNILERLMTEFSSSWVGDYAHLMMMGIKQNSKDNYEGWIQWIETCLSNVDYQRLDNTTNQTFEALKRIEGNGLENPDFKEMTYFALILAHLNRGEPSKAKEFLGEIKTDMLLADVKRKIQILESKNSF